MKKRGFTLIELLIVVAIIAILAAIAVPNLLEAQVRSKVTRVKADMRSYATALEAYAVDNNEYPCQLGPNDLPACGGLENSFIRLSTPVSFLSNSMFVEPFNAKQGWIMYRGWNVVDAGGPPPDAGTRQAIYTYVALPSDELAQIFAPAIAALAPSPYNTVPISEYLRVARRRWFLISPGPDTFYTFDQVIRTNGGDIIGGIAAQIAESTLEQFNGIYDPSNGTVSHGDIVRTAQGGFNQGGK